MKAGDVVQFIVLAVLWGGSYLFIRVAVPEFGPAFLGLVRLALGAVLLGAYALVTDRRLALRRHAGPLILLGALNAAVPYTLIALAELHVTASLAALLTGTAPLFAAAFSALWLGERLTPPRIAGLLGGLLGVAVMVGWSPLEATTATVLSVLAMLAASASYAAAGIYARLRLRDVPVHTLALGQQLGALLWLAVPGLAWMPRHVPSTEALLSVLALGMLSTAVAYVLFFRLLASLGPTKTATVTYLIPVTGLMWGVALLDEPVTRGMLAGLGIVLGSVMLVNEVRVGAVRLVTARRRHAR